MLKKIGKVLLHIFYACCIFALASSVVLVKMAGNAFYLCAVIPLFLFINIMPSFFNCQLHSKRIRTCANGCELLRLFLLSTVVTVVFSLVGFFGKLSVGSLDFPCVACNCCGSNCFLEWYDTNLSDICSAWNPLACHRSNLWNDSNCTSGGTWHFDS